MHRWNRRYGTVFAVGAVKQTLLLLALGGTSGFLGFVWPGADPSFFVVDQPIGTGDHVELSIDTVVEFVADAAVFMGEVAVLPGAVKTGLRFL